MCPHRLHIFSVFVLHSPLQQPEKLFNLRLRRTSLRGTNFTSVFSSLRFRMLEPVLDAFLLPLCVEKMFRNWFDLLEEKGRIKSLFANSFEWSYNVSCSSANLSKDRPRAYTKRSTVRVESDANEKMCERRRYLGRGFKLCPLIFFYQCFFHHR